MIDNTHVVVLRGTGREMIPVPEMEAFGDLSRSYSRLTNWATPIAPPEWKGLFSFIEGNPPRQCDGAPRTP
jgi:hypothetical protein